MTFVGNDEVECVNRDVEFLCFLLDFFLAAPDGFASEQVDRHPLDRGDVYKRVAGLRGHKIGRGEHLGIEFFFFAKILFLKSLAVHFIDLVELEAMIGVK